MAISLEEIKKISKKDLEFLKILKYKTKEIISLNEIAKKIIHIKNLKKIRIKLGFDPTSPNLHLGHIVLLNKLKQLQNFNCKIFLIIGDFTASIGDPSGNIFRPKLNKEEIKNNFKNYIKQISYIIDIKKIHICFNSIWYKKLNSINLIKIISNYNISYIMQHEDFKNRFNNKNPISISEIIYPIIQSYDSLILKSDIEIGGIDQKFNLLSARYLQKKFNINPQGIIMMPLLLGTDGINKMSKSKNNFINILDKPDIMFNKIINIPDNIIWDYFNLVLYYDDYRIDKIKKNINNKFTIRDVKFILAKKIISIFNPISIVNKVFNNFMEISKKKIPSNIKIIILKLDKINIMNLLKKINFCSSISEAGRLILQKNVSINGNIIENKFFNLYKEEFLLKIGKYNYFKIKII